MPISLVPNRRHFLAVSVAGALVARGVHAAERTNVDEARFALLADTHIPSKPEIESSKTNMAANFKSVVQQLVKLDKQPQTALLIGDCAHLEGKVGDYKLLGELVAPLAEAGLPLHMCLGNHDHRQNCLDAFAPADAPLNATVERRVGILKTKHANWFLLDSLDAVNRTPGLLGEKQLKWLVESLDAHADKPALIAVHHHLTPIPPTATAVPGLVDTPALLDLTASRKQVKAIFFGHTHRWAITPYEGMHLVNLPPVAYVFHAEDPSGWVDCQLAGDHAMLQMHCHDPAHSLQGKQFELKWRT
jgi:3',5'-cyclic AMP phosphodiesterase CpdA